MLPLQLSPAVIVHEPCDAVTFCCDRRRAIRFREERELSTCGPCNDAFIILPLRQIILSSEYAFFEQVKAVWSVLKCSLVASCEAALVHEMETHPSAE